MTIKIENATSEHSRHDQILFTFGYILRLSTSVFCCQYLRYNQVTDDKLNHLIINDLKRPSYGNLLAFVRTCTQSSIDWGPCTPFIAEFKRLLKTKAQHIPNIQKGSLLLDSFITYRNNIAHGGAILSESEYAEKAKALYAELQVILDCLLSLSDLQFLVSDETNTITVLLGKNEMEVSPLTFYNSEMEIGFMEGYDNRKHTIRYVGEKRILESNFSWSTWENMLQGFCLIPIHYKQINANWLKMRSNAIAPEFFIELEPDRYRSTFQDLLLSAESKEKLSSSDAYLSAFLFFNFSEKTPFFIDLNNADSRIDTFEILSTCLGIEPSINNIEKGKEQVLNNVLLLIYTNDEHIVKLFDPVKSDFPELEMVFLRDNPNEKMYQFQRSVYEALLSDFGIASVDWNETSADLKSIYAYSTHKNMESWIQKIAESIGKKPNLQVIEQLFEIILSSEKANNYPYLYSSLKDSGVIRSNYLDRTQFTSHVALEALFCYSLRNTSGRQKSRLIKTPPDNSPAIAKILFQNTVFEDFTEMSEGLILWICSGLIFNEEHVQPKLNELHFSLTDLSRIGIILVNFNRPDKFASFLPAIERLLKDRLTPPEDVHIDLISLIRSHCDPQLAITYLEEISRSTTEVRIKAKHQLAGILRDSGEPDKLDRATGIYLEILNERYLEIEQRVWTTCGLAESFYLLNKREAVTILLEILDRKEIKENTYLRCIVLHRIAAAFYHFGESDEALHYSDWLIRESNDIGGKLGSRIYNTHSRILAGRNSPDSLLYAEKSLKIKKALGDRRGIQISLLNMSQILQYSNPERSISCATEALELAKLIHDEKGQLLALRRLKTLNKNNPEIKEQIQFEINKLTKNE